ncbi:hypothetical protein ACLOJK_004094, partial [Asimina triloba]
SGSKKYLAIQPRHLLKARRTSSSDHLRLFNNSSLVAHVSLFMELIASIATMNLWDPHSKPNASTLPMISLNAWIFYVTVADSSMTILAISELGILDSSKRVMFGPITFLRSEVNSHLERFRDELSVKAPVEDVWIIVDELNELGIGETQGLEELHLGLEGGDGVGEEEAGMENNEIRDLGVVETVSFKELKDGIGLLGGVFEADSSGDREGSLWGEAVGVDEVGDGERGRQKLMEEELRVSTNAISDASEHSML